MTSRTKPACRNEIKPSVRGALPARWALLAAGLGAAGCNVLFGIEEGQVSGPGYEEGSGGGGGAGGVAPGGGGQGGKSGSGGAGGSGAASGASGKGGAGGVVVTCSGAETQCGTRCVDLATAPTDCGACDHDCGGGSCTIGVCQPVQVDVQTAPVAAIAVGPSEIYFSTPEGPGAAPPKLFACPKAGCTLTPRQLAAMAYYIGPIAYVPGSVVFESAPTQSTTRPAIYGCPEAGCSGTPTSLASDGLNGFVGSVFAAGSRVFYNGGGIGLGTSNCEAGVCTDGASLNVKGLSALSADDTRLAFVDTSANGFRLATCDYGGGTCVATPLVAGDHSEVEATQVHKGTFYFMLPGREGFFEGKLRACSFSDGCASVTDLAKGLDEPTTLLVDDSGSYWFSKSSPKLQHCAPDLCTGGAQDLTGVLDAPSSLTADDRFVYWISAGAVWRVAKP